MLMPETPCGQSSLTRLLTDQVPDYSACCGDNKRASESK